MRQLPRRLLAFLAPRIDPDEKPYRVQLVRAAIRVSLVLPNDTDTPQLAYENRYKPPELKYLLPANSVIPAEVTAHNILQGMERNQYEICPDSGSRLFVRAAGMLGGGLHPILDWLLKRTKTRIRLLNDKA